MDTKYINDGKRGDTKKRSDTLESLVVSDGTRREKMWFAEQDSAQHVYDCLTSFLENKFKHIRGTTFELLYRDAEGDEITVKTPAELKEAIRCLRSASTVEFRYQAAPQITMRTVDDKTVAANAHAGRVEMTPVVHNARPDGVLGAVIIDAVANQSTNTGGERQTLESVDAVTKSPVIGFPGANSDCARQTLESELKKMYEAGTRPFDENCGSGWWYVIPFALQLLFIILRICQVINWPYKLLFIPTQIAFAWWYLLRRIVIVTLDRNGFFEKLFQHAMILAPNLSHPKFWFSHLPTFLDMWTNGGRIAIVILLPLRADDVSGTGSFSLIAWTCLLAPLGIEIFFEARSFTLRLWPSKQLMLEHVWSHPVQAPWYAFSSFGGGGWRTFIYAAYVQIALMAARLDGSLNCTWLVVFLPIWFIGVCWWLVYAYLILIRMIPRFSVTWLYAITTFILMSGTMAASFLFFIDIAKQLDQGYSASLFGPPGQFLLLLFAVLFGSWLTFALLHDAGKNATIGNDARGFEILLLSESEFQNSLSVRLQNSQSRAPQNLPLEDDGILDPSLRATWNDFHSMVLEKEAETKNTEQRLLQTNSESVPTNSITLQTNSETLHTDQKHTIEPPHVRLQKNTPNRSRLGKRLGDHGLIERDSEWMDERLVDAITDQLMLRGRIKPSKPWLAGGREQLRLWFITNVLGRGSSYVNNGSDHQAVSYISPANGIADEGGLQTAIAVQTDLEKIAAHLECRIAIVTELRQSKFVLLCQGPSVTYAEPLILSCHLDAGGGVKFSSVVRDYGQPSEEEEAAQSCVVRHRWFLFGLSAYVTLGLTLSLHTCGKTAFIPDPSMVDDRGSPIWACPTAPEIWTSIMLCALGWISALVFFFSYVSCCCNISRPFGFDPKNNRAANLKFTESGFVSTGPAQGDGTIVGVSILILLSVILLSLLFTTSFRDPDSGVVVYRISFVYGAFVCNYISIWCTNLAWVADYHSENRHSDNRQTHASRMNHDSDTIAPSAHSRAERQSSPETEDVTLKTESVNREAHITPTANDVKSFGNDGKGFDSKTSYGSCPSDGPMDVEDDPSTIIDSVAETQFQHISRMCFDWDSKYNSMDEKIVGRGSVALRLLRMLCVLIAYVMICISAARMNSVRVSAELANFGSTESFTMDLNCRHVNATNQLVGNFTNFCLPQPTFDAGCANSGRSLQPFFDSSMVWFILIGIPVYFYVAFLVIAAGEKCWGPGARPSCRCCITGKIDRLWIRKLGSPFYCVSLILLMLCIYSFIFTTTVRARAIIQLCEPILRDGSVSSIQNCQIPLSDFSDQTKAAILAQDCPGATLDQPTASTMLVIALRPSHSISLTVRNQIHSAVTPLAWAFFLMFVPLVLVDPRHCCWPRKRPTPVPSHPM